MKYGLEPPSQLAEAGERAEPPPLRLDLPRAVAAGRARRRGRERVSAPTRTRTEPELRHSPLDARAPRARRADGAVRRLGDAAPVHRRARGAPGVPRARGRVRRVAPRHGRVPRRRARTTRCSGCSPTTSAGSARAGRSTRTCSTRPTPTSSTTSSCGGSSADRFLVMPNASNTDRLVDRGRGSDAPRSRARSRSRDVTATPRGARGAGPEARRAARRR